MTVVVYICSSFRNEYLNRQLAELLENGGYEAYLPQRDTPQHRTPREIYRENIQAIDRCDVFLAVLTNHGKDFGFEVGYAKGKQKPVIGFAEDDS